MQIAMISSWRVACGIARYTEELVAALSQSPDCQVSVLPAGPQVWREEGRRLGWWWERTYWGDVAHYAQSADLVHLQFAPHFFGGFHPLRNLLPFFLRRLTVPTVVTVHEVDLTGQGWKATLKRWQQQHWWRSRRVCHLIALNRFVADQLAQLGYSQVTLIPMWVPELAHRPDPKAARERLGVGERFLIVAFGFIGARRGYELLLQALLYLPKEVLVVLAGGPHPLDRSDYYSRLMRQIAEHPQRHQIHVTGFLPDEAVDDWLAAADVIVAPFWKLSGSASLMRALAHAKPIVASDLPPLRELAEESGAIWLVPNEPEAWAEAISRLGIDEVLRRRLSDAAYLFAQRRTVAEAARQHLALYKATLCHN